MKLLALGLIIPLTACTFSGNGDDKGAGVPAQGTGTTRTYQVADFSGIDLRGGDDVDVRIGTGFSIRAEGPSADLDQLRIARDGDTLKVGRKRGSGVKWGNSGKVTVFVTLRRLAEANVAGSGTMSVDRIEGGKFEAGIAGSGGLKIGALKVDEVEFSVAGSGDASAAGTAKSLKINMAGSGDIDAGGLRAQSADVSIAGSGNVRAVVDGAATISMMGSGDVDLGPNAHCTVSKMGSGTVRCAP